MKALEKERGRRYPTANDLVRDIQHYLRHEPVEARPPSGVYRFRKFTRRNRVALVTTALVAAALVMGTIGSIWQAIRARQAETVAEVGATKRSCSGDSPRRISIKRAKRWTTTLFQFATAND